MVWGKYLLESQILGLEALVTALGGADDGGVTDQWVMDSRIRDQICLELVQIDIEGAIEPEGASNTANYLCDQTIEMFERRTWDIQVAAADVIDSFIVD